jgi:hypothetical protein
MLTFVHAAAADSTLDPTRRGDVDERTRLFAAQSTMFARLLIEREGPHVIGQLARGYVAGRSFNDMIAEFHNAPHTVVDLERTWKMWLDTREN